MKKLWHIFALCGGMLPAFAIASFIQNPIPPSTEKNFFKDRNGDGKMDIVEWTFLGNLTKDYLDSAVDSLTFTWPDSNGNIRNFCIKGTELLIDSSSSRKLLLNLSKDNNIQAKQTAIWGSFGSSFIYYKGNSPIEIQMKDGMAPAIKRAYLKSSKGNGSDTLKVSFTEGVAEVQSSSDIFEYKSYNTQDMQPISGTSVLWNPENTEATIIWTSSTTSVIPKDSLRILSYTLKDSSQNKVQSGSAFTKIEGTYPFEIRTNTLIEFSHSEAMQKKSIFERIFANPSDSLPQKENAGVAIDIGGEELATSIREALGDSSIKIDPSKISILIDLRLYTNLGEYVTSIHTETQCSDARFPNFNCLENAKTLFLKWNLMSNDRRIVGTGAYIAKIFAGITYNNTTIWRNDNETNAVQVWGVHRK
ncbi:MAG: hypothetical protein WCR04_10415 [Fibrobacteraceae bacterium]